MKYIWNFSKNSRMNSKNYTPALTQAENERIDSLMAELEKVQRREELIKKELRSLIYKIEKPR